MILPDRESIRKRFDQYTDCQLMEVLRNYKNYREEAVEVAVELGMQRKLISSRQDLFSSGFNQAAVQPKKMFPIFNSPEQEAKMQASLLRIVWLISLIPAIFAVMGFAGGRDPLPATLWGAGALAWAVVTWRIEKTGNARLVFLLALLLFLCFPILYLSAARYMFNPGSMGIAVYIISILVFFYLLCYLYVILRRKARRA